MGAPRKARLPASDGSLRAGFARDCARGCALSAGRAALSGTSCPDFRSAEGRTRVAALRLAPGASPPNRYRPAGAGLRSRDAMPFGHPCGAATPSLRGATRSAPPRTRPWAGWGCGRLPLPPLRGAPCWPGEESIRTESKPAQPGWPIHHPCDPACPFGWNGSPMPRLAASTTRTARPQGQQPIAPGCPGRCS